MFSKAILSEHRPPSDSSGVFKGHLVRTSGIFGQLWSFLRHSCPNFGHLRTALVFSKALMSELRAPSDSPRCCQRHSCPNFGRLRTDLVIPMALMSELRASSDSSGDFKGNHVPTSGAFGQLWCFLRHSCPNFGLLRTDHTVFNIYRLYTLTLV